MSSETNSDNKPIFWAHIILAMCIPICLYLLFLSSETCRCLSITFHAAQVHLPSYLPLQCLLFMLPVGMRIVIIPCQMHTRNIHLPELTIFLPWPSLSSCMQHTILCLCICLFFYSSYQSRHFWVRIYRLNSWLASDHMHRLTSDYGIIFSCILCY